MIQRVKIENFFSIQSFELDLRDLGLVLIEGINEANSGSNSNGSGKSSFLEAILWCLYERTVRGYSKDEVICNKTEEGCMVEVDISLGPEYPSPITIRRSRKHKKHGTNFQIEGSEISPGKANEIAAVKSVVGLDYKGFLYSIMMGQNSDTILASASDKDQKSLYESVLISEDFSLIQAKIKDDISASSSQIDLLKRDLELGATQSETLGRDLIEAKTNAKQWGEHQSVCVNNKKSELAASIQLQSQYEAEVSDLNTGFKQSEESITKARTVIKNCESSLKDLEKTNNKTISEIINKQNIFQIELNRLRSSQGTLGDEIKKLQQEKEVLGETSRCRVCYSLITSETKQNHINHLSEKVIEIDREIQKFETHVTALIDQRVKITKEYENSLHPFKKSLEDWTKYENDLKPVYTNLQQSLHIATQRVNNNNTAIELLKNDIKHLSEQTNPYQYEKIQKSLEDLQSKLSNYPFQITEFEKKQKHLEFMFEMFGDSGLKSYLFDFIVGPLNAKAEYYSRLLTNGEVAVEFNTVKQLKNGQFRENFNIKVTNKYGSSDYIGLSEGEKKRANIIILKSVKEILNSRLSRDLNCTFFDEFTTDLDSSGKELVFHLIEEEVKEKGTVFVVTHDPEWKIRFEEKGRRVLTVTKAEDGISRFTKNW